VPGFIGVGKAYVSSRKFIAAEGGHQRIVWMPRELKDTLGEDLEEIGRGLGIENFVEMIADETIGTDAAAVRAHMERVNHPALAMWDVTTPSPEAAAVDSANAQVVEPALSKSQAAPVTGATETQVAVAERLLGNEALVPAAAVTAPAILPSSPNHEIGQIIATLERVRSVPLRIREQAGMSPEQQIGVLQASTALHLLHAGANMLLIESGALALASSSSLPALGSIQSELTAPCPTPAPPEVRHERTRAAGPETEEHPISSARIAVPTSFSLPREKSNVSITTVTLGGSGTRSSAVTIGGAEVLPFRHF
jgi:hypothetical protein